MRGIVLKLVASINKRMCYYLLIMIMPLMHHKSFHQKIVVLRHNFYKHPTLKATLTGSITARKGMGGKEQIRCRRLAVGRDPGSVCEASLP